MTKTEKLEMMRTMLLDGNTYQKIGDEFGISRQRVEQLLSPPKTILLAVKERAKGRCEDCGIILATGGHLHHINNDTIKADQFNDTANIEYLCQSCHHRIHFPGNGGSHKDSQIISIRIRNPIVLKAEKIATKQGCTLHSWIVELITKNIK
jgi:uncharacterized protein YlaI